MSTTEQNIIQAKSETVIYLGGKSCPSQSETLAESFVLSKWSPRKHEKFVVGALPPPLSSNRRSRNKTRTLPLAPSVGRRAAPMTDHVVATAGCRPRSGLATFTCTDRRWVRISAQPQPSMTVNSSVSSSGYTCSLENLLVSSKMYFLSVSFGRSSSSMANRNGSSATGWISKHTRQT